MKKILLTFAVLICLSSNAQIGPEITSWLQNTTGTGTFYNSGNSTAQSNNILYNVQSVCYIPNFVFITTTGVPSYTTGPFLDGNPSNATNQGNIYKIPRNPVPETGMNASTTGGTIGVFINGVSLFDYRDGVAWNNNTNALCGGPGNPTCPGGPMATQAWNRDAIPAEMGGFDCAKGHPAMGNYHHHQNPSAFDLDLNVLSTICNLYDADGLYAIDSATHSPLIGYAYDGYPIYGAYAYTNTNGTGAITRMKSSYQLNTATTRLNGPPINATYFNGYFREDYSYSANTASDYLDEHNGRFAVTPEYPAGTYAYYATVDANWNSAYPYVVGPTFYGVYANRSITTINAPCTTYVAVPLPLGFLNFSGDVFDNYANLFWETSNEIETDYFVLEISDNAENFIEIGNLAASSNGKNKYSFKYLETLNRLKYFRIKQVDMDGQFTYSNIIKLNPLDLGTEGVKIFPNPSGDFIALQLKGLNTEIIQLRLLDMTGKLLRSEKIVPGSTIGYLDTRTLYDGTYIVQIISDTEFISKKVVVQH